MGQSIVCAHILKYFMKLNWIHITHFHLRRFYDKYFSENDFFFICPKKQLLFSNGFVPFLYSNFSLVIYSTQFQSQKTQFDLISWSI